MPAPTKPAKATKAAKPATKPAAKPELAQIAHVARDPFNQYYQGIMRPNDATLATRGGPAGIDTYDDIERDPSAYAVLSKRKSGLTSRTWYVDAATDAPRDQAAADLVRRNLSSIPFNRLCKNLLDATLKGYAVGEIIWHEKDGEILIKKMLARNQRRFVFDLDNNPRLLTTADMIRGEELPERKFIVHRFGGKSDNPYGLGLGSRLFWPVFFKRKGIGFWLTLADKFGAPTAVGKYQRGASDEDKDALIGFLQGIATDAGFAIPDDMSVELLEAARGGNIDTHEKLCRYMDEEISKCVLGETLSTSMQGTGSYGAAKTHNEVRLELVQDDADDLSETLNGTIAQWLIDYNMPGAGYPKIHRDVSEKRDLQGQSQTDTALHNMGWQPSQEYINNTYGEGWTPRAAPAKPQPAPKARPEFAEPGSAYPPDQAALDAMLDNLPPAASAALQPLLTAINDIFQNAATPDEALDTLLEQFPTLPMDDLVEALTSAQAIADLWGRATSAKATP
jgi:phage gp29-like protein